ncbi:MAG: cation-transporting P-type ATPase [Cytophagaceae bacterium]
MKELPQKEWHALESKEVIKLLETDPENGISGKEVEKRVSDYGLNIITPQKNKSFLRRFLSQFNQALIYILLVATLASFLLEEYIDGIVIFAVVLINALVGFIQENKALNAIEALSKSMTSKNTVVRDGKKLELDSTEILPGDLVILQAGDKVPADIRLISIKDLRIDESVLTGESVPVNKNANSLKENMVLGDRLNMAYASTMVAFGQGKGIVIGTGDHTEVGRISGFISSSTDIDTPLTKKIKSFSILLLYLILGFAFISLLVGLLHGEEFRDIFMAAVALAVAAIPEGLPAAVTIMLAIGVTKMARQKAIIRKLAAVETLGSTTIVCSDKTGTLTENQMTIQKIYAGKSMYDVSGLGYAPEGEVLKDGKKVNLSDDVSLDEVIKCGMLCNDSNVVQKNGQWMVKGDPTEGAMVVSGFKAGYQCEDLNSKYPRKDAIPFESDYMYMATLHPYEGKMRCYIKGSLEALLPKCSKTLKADGTRDEVDIELLEEKVADLAADGLRVLAFAYKDFDSDKADINHKDIKDELVFLGLQGMIDPPRKEAINAVKICKNAGIYVKMITGDHALTASTIAGQLGLEGKMKDGRLLTKTGLELEKLDNGEFEKVAVDTAVFARVSPEQKLRLVKALQRQGNIVAMTGDGVNDGPALKQANIGIAMGITGTEVAKEASDMVLTDDNFKSIEKAIEEGRGVFDNLVKYIVWILPTNLGQGLVIMVSILLGTVLYIQPVQALWINMTTAILLGLMLAFEPKEPGIMDRKPKHPDKPILTRHLIIRTFLVGVLLLIAAVSLFYYEINLGASLDEARTVVTTVFIVLQSFYLVNCRSLLKPLGQIGYFTNWWIYAGIGVMLLFQTMFIYLPFMNVAFHTVPISLNSWLRVLGSGLILYLVIEIEKKIVISLQDKSEK